MTTHPKKAAGKKAVPVVLSCTEPDCNFNTKVSAYAKQELGRHMKFVHSVPGSSSSAQLMQSKKAPTNGSIELAMTPLTAEEQQLVPATKRTYTRRSNINVGYDTEALINVGKIIAACEAQAEKLGAPKESFTKRCAELFYASQVR